MPEPRTLNPTKPIILGLAGEAATGKTVTAREIAPYARAAPAPLTIVWEHFYFAMPIYEMVSIKSKTLGDLAFERQCYLIHDVLVDVLGHPVYGGPPYAELVDMVLQIVDYPMPADPEEKPRSFMQWVGTEVVRAYDPDAWVKWLDRKIKAEFIRFQADTADLDFLALFGVVISDARFENEVAYVNSSPNRAMVKLTCDPHVRAERILARDGVLMTEEQLAHASETGLAALPDDAFDLILDTTFLTLQLQAGAVREFVDDMAGISQPQTSSHLSIVK